MVTRMLKSKNKSKLMKSEHIYKLSDKERKILSNSSKKRIKIEPKTLFGTIEDIPSRSPQTSLFKECWCYDPKTYKNERIRKNKIENETVKQICYRCSHHFRLARTTNHGDICPLKNCSCKECQKQSEWLKIQLNRVNIGRENKRKASNDLNNDIVGLTGKFTKC